MTNNKRERFWEVVSAIFIVLAILLYLVFLFVGKSKDCASTEEGFTFSHFTHPLQRSSSNGEGD